MASKLSLSSLVHAALAGWLVFGAAPTLAESTFSMGKGSASATVRIRVVVAPMLRILENQHSEWTANPGAGSTVSQQKIVIASNIPQGFCIDLSRHETEGQSWHINPLQTSGAQISPSPDGYKVCGAAPGLYTVMLEHTFEQTVQQANAQAWPIQTQISSI